MTTINTYLNFDGKAEEAFNFYKSVFGGEFAMFQRLKDAPGTEQLSAEEQNRIMHIALPIGSNMLMATDIVPSMGHILTVGSNYHISLGPDSEDETHRLYNALSEGGNVTMPLDKMFWGALYGAFTDKFGINWMINYELPK
jgi:PhnB protein